MNRRGENRMLFFNLVTFTNFEKKLPIVCFHEPQRGSVEGDTPFQEIAFPVEFGRSDSSNTLKLSEYEIVLRVTKYPI
jgi:hypothetical protein